MDGLVGITDLPTEVLINILRCDQLTWIDLLSVYQTCPRLQHVAAADSLWRPKLLNKWPDRENGIRADLDWFKECKNMIQTFEFCRENIMKISPAYYRSLSVLSVSDYYMEDYLNMCNMYDGLGEMYLLMFLRDLCSREINIEGSKPHTELYNLTNQYYASIILDYLNQNFLKKQWLQISQNTPTLTPEKAALFFGQWMQPEYEELDSYFDAAISAVIKIMKSSLSSDHPLHKVKPEETQKWSKELIFENKYDPKYCKEVIKSTIDVLKNKRLLSSGEPIITSMTIQNVIDRKRSNQYYSLVILEAILRRCGVHIEMLYFQNRQLLWQENWSTESVVYSINPFNGEMAPSEKLYPVKSKPGFNCYIANTFLLKMAMYMKNLDNGRTSKFKRALELKAFLEPQVVSHWVDLGLEYLRLKNDTRYLGEDLKAVLEMEIMTDVIRGDVEYDLPRLRNAVERHQNGRCSIPTRTVKLRSDSIEFAVGQVCYHKISNYLCVIYGWDHVFIPPEYESRIYYESAELETHKKPFYHVLLADCSKKYIPQENLIWPVKPKRLKFIDNRIGKHFSHFDGYVFVPNLEKEEEYPDDGLARAAYRNFYESKRKRKIDE